MVSSVLLHVSEFHLPLQMTVHALEGDYFRSTVRYGPKSAMPIEAASSVRAAAADYREAVRHFAHQSAVERAEARRDQRVEEAKEAVASRPRPQDRADPSPPRAPAPDLLIDVLA